jgi:hypothetical protein
VRWVAPYWQRGMSYLKLGWNWIRLAITHQWTIPVFWFLHITDAPCPAQASRKQFNCSLEREFVVQKHLPAS